MPSAEEEEERAFFDDDDDDDDDDMEGDDSEEEEEEDYEDEDAEAVPPPAFAGAAAAAGPPLPAEPAEEGLNGSTPSTSSSSDRAPPNPNPNPTTVADPGSAPQNGAISILPLSAAAPSTPAVAGGLFTPSSSDPVTQPSEDRKPFPVAVAAVGGGYDDSRRLFQRLWTDEEEVTILQGFLEFTSRRGTTFASHQYDTGPFYEEIKKQLQLEFTKNQLIEKLRRLKKKYRNVVSRMRSMGKDFAFRSSHEKAIYEIACNIWSANVKRARESDDDDDLNTPNNAYTIEAISGPDGSLNTDRRMSRSRRRFRRRTATATAAAAAAAAASAAAVAASPATVGAPVENSVPVTQVPSSLAPAIPGIIEETVKSCLSPLFKELIYSATAGPLGPGLGGGAGLLGPGLGGAAAALSPVPFCLGGSPASLPGSGAAVDEKWKKQQILELEVYLKRMELLRDQIKSTLEELKSSGS